MPLIWQEGKAGYFLTWGWTRKIGLKLLGKLPFARTRFCGAD
jgi:hypothetical protein